MSIFNIYLNTLLDVSQNAKRAGWECGICEEEGSAVWGCHYAYVGVSAVP